MTGKKLREMTQDEMRQYKRERYHANKDKALAYQKQYYQANKEQRAFKKTGIMPPKPAVLVAEFVLPTGTTPAFKVPVYHFGV